jgi:fructose-1,6-bisphosphatase I
VSLIVSEENTDPIFVEGAAGDYIVAMDPLDGSSNIDVSFLFIAVVCCYCIVLKNCGCCFCQVNISIGSIFAIYHREANRTGPFTLEDVLRPGSEMIAAGYTM